MTGTPTIAPLGPQNASGVFELSHFMRADLQFSGTLDLAIAGAAERSKQRVLRRLLTNPGDYIWHPEYGAGLPRRIGDPLNVPELKALVVSQMFLEKGVARSPRPTVDVSEIGDGTGRYVITVSYTDFETGQPAVLRFSPQDYS